MEADSSDQQLVKHSHVEYEDVNDDGLRPNQEVALASGILKLVMDREKETRIMERDLRYRTEKVMQAERNRLDDEIQWERQEARRRFELEQKSALGREMKAREWEDRVIGEVMRREEDLRRREREFMDHWETQRTLEKMRALKHELAVMTTERNLSALYKDMANGERQRKWEGVKDFIFLAVTFLTVFIYVMSVTFF